MLDDVCTRFRLRECRFDVCAVSFYSFIWHNDVACRQVCSQDGHSKQSSRQTKTDQSRSEKDDELDTQGSLRA